MDSLLVCRKGNARKIHHSSSISHRLPAVDVFPFRPLFSSATQNKSFSFPRECAAASSRNYLGRGEEAAEQDLPVGAAAPLVYSLHERHAMIVLVGRFDRLRPAVRQNKPRRIIKGGGGSDRR